MSVLYPPEVKEAARVLYRRDVSAARTKELLEEGKAGLDQIYSPSISSIEKWRQDFKREGEYRGFAVEPGQEKQVEDAIYQDALAAARIAVKRLKEQELKGTADAGFPARVKTYVSMIDGRRAREKRDRENQSPDPIAARDATPQSMLHRMTRERLETESDNPGEQSEANTDQQGIEEQRDTETDPSTTEEPVTD